LLWKIEGQTMKHWTQLFFLFGVVCLVGCDTSSNDETDCADIRGAWDFSEQVAVTCTVAGDQETATMSGSGTIDIEQDGCSFRFSAPEGPVRNGEIDGTRIRMENPFILDVGVGIDFSENRAIAEGALSPDGNTISLTGTGTASGFIEGERFSCTGTSTAEFTRERMAGDITLSSRGRLQGSRSLEIPSFPGLSFSW